MLQGSRVFLIGDVNDVLGAELFFVWSIHADVRKYDVNHVPKKG